jgi:hypothetical protein
VIGITSLLENSDGSANDAPVHKLHQYWVVCKCREEQSLRLPVKQEFNIAKFSDH